MLGLKNIRNYWDAVSEKVLGGINNILQPCLTNLVFWAKNTTLYFITNKISLGDAVLKSSNCMYYDGVDDYSDITNSYIGLLSYFTVNYSNDGDDWSETFDSRTDSELNFEVINNYTLRITPASAMWLGLLTGYNENGVKLFQFTLASGSDNIDVSQVTQFNMTFEGDNLKIGENNLINKV